MNPSRKRPLPTAASENQLREHKRFKDSAPPPNKDKKRRKKKKRNLPVTAPVAMASRARVKETQSPNGRQEMHKLNDELDRYKKAMALMQESLSCQICLDLLHRPYALTPCGHVTCYTCLVQWFTTQNEQAPLTNLLTKKKTCPHCRTVIGERPIEVWEMKRMVDELLKSGIFTGPSQQNPVESSSEDTDPWKNIFPKPFSGVPNPDWHDLPVQDVGIFDAEDGGIYRCLDCMHEIWHDGTCSGCQRRYPGHLALNEDVVFAEFSGEELDAGDEDGDGYEHSFIDDSDYESDHHLPVFPLVPLISDNYSSDSEEQEVGAAMFSDSHSETGVIELSSDDNEDELVEPVVRIDTDSSGSEDEDELPLHRRSSAFIIDDDDSSVVDSES